jgi:hypothetical protein
MSSIKTSGLLAPIIALNGWTLVMEIWMLATRIPVLQRLKATDDNTTTIEQLNTKIPASVRWKADNYNNLMQQPMQFYAVALVLAIARAGKNEATDVKLAWAYVAARILHSLVHCTENKVSRRFALFITSSAILAGMTGRAAQLLWK